MIVDYSAEAAQSHSGRGPAMESVKFVGLDVHAESVAIAVAERSLPPALLGVFPNDIPSLLKRLRRMGRIRCCYEAGPTGYGLQRALAEAGIECIVVAPSLVPSTAGERIKTDRRDAVKLARFLRSGDLTPIAVPETDTEAMRDLVRARDAAKRAERAARQQLTSFLLRHGRRYPGKKTWTEAHDKWLRGQVFDNEAHRRVLDDALRVVYEATERVKRLTASIAELIGSSAVGPLVKALQSFRGVDLVSAAIIGAEIGDLRRFESAPQFMSYLGLVPSERSSGFERRQGAITRAGNGSVRRILVEASWAYRHRPYVGKALRSRSRGVSEEVRQIAWRAQGRLWAKRQRLLARGKPANKAAAAVARELAGFIWSVGRADRLLA
jgi:transposase